MQYGRKIAPWKSQTTEPQQTQQAQQGMVPQQQNEVIPHVGICPNCGYNEENPRRPHKHRKGFTFCGDCGFRMKDEVLLSYDIEYCPRCNYAGNNPSMLHQNKGIYLFCGRCGTLIRQSI